MSRVSSPTGAWDDVTGPCGQSERSPARGAIGCGTTQLAERHTPTTWTRATSVTPKFAAGILAFAFRSHLLRSRSWYVWRGASPRSKTRALRAGALDFWRSCRRNWSRKKQRVTCFCSCDRTTSS